MDPDWQEAQHGANYQRLSLSSIFFRNWLDPDLMRQSADIKIQWQGTWNPHDELNVWKVSWRDWFNPEVRLKTWATGERSQFEGRRRVLYHNTNQSCVARKHGQNKNICRMRKYEKEHSHAKLIKQHRTKLFQIPIVVDLLCCCCCHCCWLRILVVYLWEIASIDSLLRFSQAAAAEAAEVTRIFACSPISLSCMHTRSLWAKALPICPLSL